MDYPTDPMNDLDSQQPRHLHAPGQRPRTPVNKKKLFIIVGIVVAVLLAGVAAFFWLSGRDNKSATQNTAGNEQPQTQEDEEPTMPPAEAAQPQQYKSEALNIEITHRKDWTVKESADNKLLTVTSPKFNYETKDGGNARGSFTLKISLGTTEEAQATINEAKAVRDSLLIGYDAPTEAQRHYTNVSYAGPDQETFSFLVVSGSEAFKPGDPLAGRIVINSGDFLIAGGFGADSQNALAFDKLDPTGLDQYTAYEQAMAIIRSLKVF